MYIVFHGLLFVVGFVLVGHAMGRDGDLFGKLEARLSRGLTHPGQPADLVLQGPEFWLPMMVLGGGFVLLWGAIGLIPAVLQVIGAIGAALGAVLTFIFRSTAFQIALFCMLFYVGQVAFTGFMVQDIFEGHIRPAARELDLRFDQKPDLNEQIRRFRDLVKELERI